MASGTDMNSGSSNAELQRRLECPVCLKFMDRQIFMCESGHPVCGPCKDELRDRGCHSCEKPFLNTRVLGLEHVSEVVYRPCDSVNCDALITTANKGEHMLECNHRAVNCTLCDWTGELVALLGHIKASHQFRNGLSDFQLGETFQISEPVNNFRQEGRALHFYAIDDSGDMLFLVELKNDDGCVWLCAKMCGTMTRANQFRVEVKISTQTTNNDDQVRSQFKMTEDMHCDLEHQDGLCVPLTSVKGMEKAGWVDMRGMMTIVCRIFEKAERKEHQVEKKKRKRDDGGEGLSSRDMERNSRELKGKSQCSQAKMKKNDAGEGTSSQSVNALEHGGGGRHGFDRGLVAEKILDAEKVNGELTFLVKWRGKRGRELVPFSVCNIRCPELVIQFYETRLDWEIPE